MCPHYSSGSGRRRQQRRASAILDAAVVSRGALEKIAGEITEISLGLGHQYTVYPLQLDFSKRASDPIALSGEPTDPQFVQPLCVVSSCATMAGSFYLTTLLLFLVKTGDYNSTPALINISWLRGLGGYKRRRFFVFPCNEVAE